ncbi:MAG TPA: MauE/DoxX family redox-associated membrane protein [Streptosporangiaceae bacterium]|nr:MauE/DoxX family redox-associated membrane protein [Streptosporangiaceae bacterium]
MPTAVLAAVREVQIPLLTLMLLGGSGAKVVKVVRSRALAVGLGPTALFPLRLRRPIAMAVCATEFGLGIGLVVTAGKLGAGLPATIVRAGVSLLFLTAVGALVELRERRPDAGCGCFGELSVTPVGNRTIARSAVLALAAIVTVGQPPLRMPESGEMATVWIVAVVAELLLLAALSPELGQAMARLGYSEPCEVRRISVDRTLTALAGSAPWRRYAGLITEPAPSDIWREGCWRYLVYPGQSEGRPVDLVFAVSLRSRRPQVQVAVLDAVTDEVLAGTPQTRPIPDRTGDRPLAGSAGPRYRPGEPSLPYQPDLEATRPMAGLGARASLDQRAVYGNHSVGLPVRPARSARSGLDAAARVGEPARHRSSAPF